MQESRSVQGNPNCEDCVLFATAEHTCIMGRGPVPCDVMIMGEAPGHREDDVGKPFQGSAGKLLDRLLNEVGMSREDIYITNAVKCRPPQNRTPSVSEIKACRKYFFIELDAVKPKFILLLGGTAMKSVVGNSGVKKNRGMIYKVGDSQVMATYHPAAVLRTPSLESALKSDLRRFKRLVDGTLDDDHHLKMEIVNTKADLMLALDQLRKAPVVSYDLETNCLDPMAPGATIFVIGAATPDRQYILPADYPGSRFKGQTKRLIELFYDAVKDTKLVAHNSKFDNKWLKVHGGVDMPTTFDTMLASYVLDENRTHGLKDLSKTYYQAPQYELPQPVNPKTVPLQKLATYCAWDVYYTMKLYEDFKAELLEDKRLVNVFKYLLIPASKALESAELYGVFLDLPKHGQAVAMNMSRLEQEDETLKQLVGRSINWNSPLQVGQLLFHELKLPQLEITKTGKPSTAESVLLQLRGKHEVIDHLLKYREYKKLGEFLASWSDHLSSDSRMHPGFLLHGTVTGRLSCREPNLQQVPRDTFLRSLITAPKGKVFVEADYSQVELRVAAMISGDVQMKMAFQTGQDVHAITASSVMDIPIEEVTKADRKKAKAVNFGFLYGMGAKKFQIYARDKYDVHLDEMEAQAFRERFFDTFSGLPSWHERQRRLANKYGYIRTPLGRKRRLPDISSHDRMVRGEAERQAINSPVQGFASDLTLLSMILLAERFRPDQLQVVGLVHDAILMEIDESEQANILPVIKETMEHKVVDYVQERFGYTVTVPLEVEIKVGAWGTGQVWEEQ